jgi:hypothetical protein
MGQGYHNLREGRRNGLDLAGIFFGVIPLARHLFVHPPMNTSQGYNQGMDSNLLSKDKIDRSSLSVAYLTDASDEKGYWLGRTPHERLRQVEILRRINYGHRAARRLQRVLEIIERKRR